MMHIKIKKYNFNHKINKQMDKILTYYYYNDINHGNNDKIDYSNILQY